MDQHNCTDDGELPPVIVEPLMQLFCEPILNLIGAFFRDLYFPIVDHSLQAVLNAVVTPNVDGEDPWSTAPLTDGLVNTAMAVAGLGFGLGCCCCCFFFSPRFNQGNPETERQASFAVPTVLGEAIHDEPSEPAAHETAPRGHQVVQGSR